MERNEAARAFAAWLREQLTRRGYDLGIRGGGQTRFAQDSGIGRATVSRMLAGDGATDTRTLTLVAQTLNVPLTHVLIKAGILDENELKAVQAPITQPVRITPEQAADALGIEEPQARQLFVSMTETLQRTPAPDTDGADRAASP